MEKTEILINFNYGWKYGGWGYSFVLHETIRVIVFLESNHRKIIIKNKMYINETLKLRLRSYIFYFNIYNVRDSHEFVLEVFQG
jgi:hypothetical protein